MLCLRIEYLTGRCVATAYDDRQKAEWPPHPARVFSALVAAWADSDPPSEKERAALEWLESLQSPELSAPEKQDRTVVTHFVPVNDTAVISYPDSARLAFDQSIEEWNRAEAELVKARAQGDSKKLQKAEKALEKASRERGKREEKLREVLHKSLQPVAQPPKSALQMAAKILPDARGRQPRTFPSVTPRIPVFYLKWNAEVDPEHFSTLRDLVARVARIGHSASLVSCSLNGEGPASNYIPDDNGTEVLRVPAIGQLRRLIAAFERHREVEPRVLPCRFQRYRVGMMPRERETPKGFFGEDWIVFRRVGGPKLPIVRSVDVASALRGALIHYAEEPIPEEISGHEQDGTPIQRPHVAFVALPFVGHFHADGTLLGTALVLPRQMREEARSGVLRALGRFEEAYRREDEETPTVELKLGSTGVLELERIEWGQPPLRNLEPATWCGAATTWVSVTPIALDNNPGNLFDKDHVKAHAAHKKAAEIISKSCGNIGLPLPQSVDVLPSATLPGTCKSRHFPSFPSGPSRLRRVKVHALVRFGEPIAGPVLLGAGRYLGLGLCRPVPGESQ